MESTVEWASTIQSYLQKGASSIRGLLQDINRSKEHHSSAKAFRNLAEERSFAETFRSLAGVRSSAEAFRSFKRWNLSQ